MTTFALERITEEETESDFYKILVNGKSPFNKFCEEIYKTGTFENDLDAIQTIMQVKATGNPIPAAKWKELKRDKKDKFRDFEIKAGRLRVYLFIDERTGFIVVTGGIKKPIDQKKAIQYMRRIKIQYLTNI